MEQFIITKQPGGRYYGRIPNSDDGHGNEIDCLQETPEKALKSLMIQLREAKKYQERMKEALKEMKSRNPNRKRVLIVSKQLK